MSKRLCLIIKGQVQGVGFRPYIFRLANSTNLTGFIKNTISGVHIEIQGNQNNIQNFQDRLVNELPPLAKIEKIITSNIPLIKNELNFSIVESDNNIDHQLLVSPDIGICEDCLLEINDTTNYRFNYAFTNCTNCGPRYSIIKTMPYDRKNTTMACFELCETCLNEYNDPYNRRFHAQPIACSICGPKLSFADKDQILSGDNALEKACDIIAHGKILALKGLGGFQLIVNARSKEAINNLRIRKNRPHKSLAIMVENILIAKKICILTEQSISLLKSPEKPIVICKKIKNILPDNIAPDVNTIGIMLPNTPLHALIFKKLKNIMDNDPILIMTSGNIHNKPLCLKNREALKDLSNIADAWLLHNRDILVRVDDSVINAENDNAIFLRRARGYVPSPIYVQFSKTNKCIFGAGAELKSTLSFTRNNSIFTSQHIGDLQNVATLTFYEECFEHMTHLLNLNPEIIIYDLHPNFLSSQFAINLAKNKNLNSYKLQHHISHASSVLAENRYNDEALVLALDGTGLGEDQTIWGGELFYICLNKAEWRRIGTLSSFKLAGLDMAIHQPWRIALNFQNNDALPPLLPKDEIFKIDAILSMLKTNTNCIDTSSCGRLFDAISARLLLCKEISYEGQAAIKLEQAVDLDYLHYIEDNFFDEFPIKEQNDLYIIDSKQIYENICSYILKGLSTSKIAAYFHLLLANCYAHISYLASKKLNIKTIALTGGVFQNSIFSFLVIKALKRYKLNILTHKLLPPGDACISFGQAAWGLALLQNNKI